MRVTRPRVQTIALLVCAYLGWARPAVRRCGERLECHRGASNSSDSHPSRRHLRSSTVATVQLPCMTLSSRSTDASSPIMYGYAGASGSPEAAAAKAAHDVLVNRFPDQAASLDTTYHDYLASNGLAEDDPGVAVGQKAAAGIIALRANDGSFPATFPPFTGGTEVGVWRPTPSYLPGPPPDLIAYAGSLAGKGHSFYSGQPQTVSRGGPARSKQPQVHQRISGGQKARGTFQRSPYPRADRSGLFLGLELFRGLESSSQGRCNCPCAQDR